jgi:hypothetical protein
MSTFRIATMTVVLVWLAALSSSGQSVAPEWSMAYTRSHPAEFEQQWTYHFPTHQSTRWIIALRDPPELPWSRDVHCTAEPQTSQGGKKGELIAGMLDFDWVINAGPFGKQTVPTVDAFPAFWSEGEGSMDNPKVHTATKVRVVKRFR